MKSLKSKMPDLNAASIEAAMSMVKGTARSMGITVEEECEGGIAPLYHMEDRT